VGGTAVLGGINCLGHNGDLRFLAYCAGFLALASGVAVLIGFLTPVNCILTGVVGESIALGWIPGSLTYLSNAPLTIAFLAAITIALALLGPGALSIDALLFGRREITIPRNLASPKT